MNVRVCASAAHVSVCVLTCTVYVSGFVCVAELPRLIGFMSEDSSSQ